jgi:hypothetical protein
LPDSARTSLNIETSSNCSSSSVNWLNELVRLTFSCFDGAASPKSFALAIAAWMRPLGWPSSVACSAAASSSIAKDSRVTTTVSANSSINSRSRADRFRPMRPDRSPTTWKFFFMVAGSTGQHISRKAPPELLTAGE